MVKSGQVGEYMLIIKGLSNIFLSVPQIAFVKSIILSLIHVKSVILLSISFSK